jgi:hypothetical protein
MTTQSSDPPIAAPSQAATPAESEPAFPDAPAPAPAGRTRYDDFDIRIDRDSIWYYHGSPIQRKELVCLFGSLLRRDTRGNYWLVTPSEIVPIEVEDAPFLAVEMYCAGHGDKRMISLRTNIDEIVTIDEAYPLFMRTSSAEEGRVPYVRLSGQREAKLTRALYYELVSQAEQHEFDGRQVLGVRSGGRFFVLGPVDDDT